MLLKHGTCASPIDIFLKVSDNFAYYKIKYDYVQLKFTLLMIIAMTVAPKRINNY